MPRLAGVEWTELEDGGGLQCRMGKLRCNVAIRPRAGLYPWSVKAAPRYHVLGHEGFGTSPEFAAREALRQAAILLQARPDLLDKRDKQGAAEDAA